MTEGVKDVKSFTYQCLTCVQRALRDKDRPPTDGRGVDLLYTHIKPLYRYGTLLFRYVKPLRGYGTLLFRYVKPLRRYTALLYTHIKLLYRYGTLLSGYAKSLTDLAEWRPSPLPRARRKQGCYVLFCRILLLFYIFSRIYIVCIFIPG